MFVEDVLVAVATRLAISARTRVFGGLLDGDWYKSFLNSISNHINADRALSTNQSHSVMKLITRVRDYIIEYKLASPHEIDRLIAAPRYRRQPYESTQNVPREARYIGDNLIALRCKADSLLTERIKTLKCDNGSTLRTNPRFDWTYRIWIVPVHSYNLSAVKSLLRDHRFHVDDGTMAFLRRYQNDINQSSMVVFGDAERATLIADVCDNDVLAAWITDNADGIVL